MELNLCVQKGKKEEEENKEHAESPHTPDYKFPKCSAYIPRLGLSCIASKAEL